MQSTSTKPGKMGRQEIDEPQKCREANDSREGPCPWLDKLGCKWRKGDGTFDFGPKVREAYCPIEENTALFDMGLEKIASGLSTALAEGKTAEQLFKILGQSGYDWRFLQEVVLSFYGEFKDNPTSKELINLCRGKDLLAVGELVERFPELA